MFSIGCNLPPMLISPFALPERHRLRLWRSSMAFLWPRTGRKPDGDSQVAGCPRQPERPPPLTPHPARGTSRHDTPNGTRRGRSRKNPPSKQVILSASPQGRDRRAVDQRRQAGRQDDAPELPSVPVQRGAALAERDGLQPGQRVAAPGAAQQDRAVVADELAATVGEDGRVPNQTCPLLLAAPGGGPSDAAAACE